MLWSAGVTTVPSRRATYLPRTLESLKRGGFSDLRLFVDGCDDPKGWQSEFGLPVTPRTQLIRTHGNWFLALAELFIREPACHRYAIFQDDVVCVKNLKGWLEQQRMPERGYLNLYTFPQNQELAGPRQGWFEGVECAGSNREGPMPQRGLGACGLVFSIEGVIVLLTSSHMVERPRDVHRGHCAVDGGIVTAMNKAGWREFCHNPSLLQHVGDASAMGNAPHLKATSFPGEDFDALSLLGKQPQPLAPPALSEHDLREVAEIRRALAADEASLARVTCPKERQRLMRWVQTYRERLRRFGAG